MNINKAEIDEFIKTTVTQIPVKIHKRIIIVDNCLRILPPRSNLEFQRIQMHVAEYIYSKIRPQLKRFDIRVRYSIPHMIAHEILKNLKKNVKQT
jgi:hypothetical protein